MKRFLLIPVLLAIFATLISAFGTDNTMNPGGSPAGNTNSPGDNQNCSHCMTGTVATVTGWITSNVPGDGYVPGTTYTITATATGSGNKGFEISPQDIPGNLIGTLTAGTGNKLVGSGKYVTQSSSVGGSSATWHFTWKAPTTGVGDVTFYGAFIIGYANTKVTTLTISQNTVGIAEKELSGVSVFPNPAKDHFSVSFSHPSSGNVSMELLSMSGEKIGNLLNDFLGTGQITCSFNISQPAGVYLVQIMAGDQKEIRKVIFQ